MAFEIVANYLRPRRLSLALIEPCFDNLSRRAEPERYALYKGMMAKVRQEIADEARHALPVDAVVRAEEHAMMARKPSTRCLIGRDARLWLIFSFLPDRWRDRLILSKLRA
jgi:hypothetical protein